MQKALDEAIAKLPIPKVMSYQLETDCELPGWSSVNFVRPAHRLVALHGSTVVPVKALGLTAGNSTQGHRFEAKVATVVLAPARLPSTSVFTNSDSTNVTPRAACTSCQNQSSPAYPAPRPAPACL